MRSLKKMAALLLSVTMVFGMCACHKSSKGEILEAANSIAGFVVARDYKKLLKHASGGDDDLSEKMILDPTGDEIQKKARTYIADTLSYTIDENTYEGKSNGERGSVDIVFTYVDYEKLLSDDVVYADLKEFSSAVKKCKSRIEETVTLSFEKKEDKIVCTNINKLEVLFPYSDVEFPLAKSRMSYLGFGTFSGTEYDPSAGVYTNTGEITLSVEVLGDGQKLTWLYYYEITCEDRVIYTTDVLKEEQPEYLEADYAITGDVLSEGTYTVSFYLEDGSLLGAWSVSVKEKKAPTPTPSPTPTPAGVGDPDEITFYCPNTNDTVIPGMKVKVSLPMTMTFRDETYDSIRDTMERGNPMNLILYADDSIYALSSFSLYYLPEMHMMSKDAKAAFDKLTDAIRNGIEERGFDYKEEQTTVTVGQDNFPVCVIMEMDGDEIRNYWGVMMIGNEEVCYIATLDADKEEKMRDLLSGFSESDE